MAGRVEGKVAFITGAARGQGRAHAVRLAQEGADIIAVDICKKIDTVDLIAASTPEDLAETADLVKGHNRSIYTAEVDVRDYDALKAALDIGAEPDTNPNLKATPDTITFLTDGVPTKGDMQDGDTLLEWYTGLNRYSRVKTHTITFGDIGIDRQLLQNLAGRNGGTYIEVPEDKNARRK